tara:strand:+ start:30871 stop:31446 length:576 start_codon:yes stop_codon:yes gene_type:complete
MASTDIITPSRRLIRIGDVESNRPNSESVNQKIGGGLNFILERLFIDEDFTIGGYFNNNAFDDGSAGIRYVEKDAKVALYHLALRSSGASGINSFNVAVYDSTGAFINNLFGSGANALQISGSNGTNVVVGRKDLDQVSPSNILINNGGHTVQVGALNLTTIPAGSMLVPFVVSNGSNAINLHFKLRLKEL